MGTEARSHQDVNGCDQGVMWPPCPSSPEPTLQAGPVLWGGAHRHWLPQQQELPTRAGRAEGRLAGLHSCARLRPLRTATRCHPRIAAERRPPGLGPASEWSQELDALHHPQEP